MLAIRLNILVTTLHYVSYNIAVYWLKHYNTLAITLQYISYNIKIC